MISWTIYDHPRDYPDSYVARKFIGKDPTQEHIISGDLEFLRECMSRLGLTKLNRAPQDDSVIMEIWL